MWEFSVDLVKSNCLLSLIPLSLCTIGLNTANFNHGKEKGNMCKVAERVSYFNSKMLSQPFHFLMPLHDRISIMIIKSDIYFF